MENKKFNQLMFDANRQLDELSKMVKDTIKEEELIIDNALASRLVSIPTLPTGVSVATWNPLS